MTEKAVLYISMDYSKIFGSMELTVNEDYGVFVYNEDKEVLYENQKMTRNAKYQMEFSDFQKIQKREAEYSELHSPGKGD